ncbi:hypothetical protein INP57_29095, partial [Saccharopolyspora sp. HNM0986]|uniref:DUF6542 domain-containing protein n=1 Tax=Saccharopolyspora galaxeae TaxID=2781241 RepID=UPI00190D3BB2
MTATRERQSAPSPDDGAPRWSERSAFGNRRGVPLWGALLLALGLAVLGTAADLLINAKTATLTNSGLVIGCVLAVLLVRRASVFGPMVQPPLVTLVVPVLAMAFGAGSGSKGISGLALELVNPLINSFPMMATTTGVCVAIGLVRMFLLQRARDAESGDPEATAQKKPVRDRQPRKDSAKQEARSKEGAKRDERGRPQRRPAEGQGNRPRPDSGAAARGRPAPEQGGRPRPAPGGARGEGKPDRGERAPGRGSGGRGGERGTPPGRGQPPRGSG